MLFDTTTVLQPQSFDVSVDANNKGLRPDTTTAEIHQFFQAAVSDETILANIINGTKKFKYFAKRIPDIENQCLALSLSKSSKKRQRDDSAAKYKVMVQLGRLATQSELDKYPADYHKSMGQTKQRCFAYPILQRFNCNVTLHKKNNIDPVAIAWRPDIEKLAAIIFVDPTPAAAAPSAAPIPNDEPIAVAVKYVKKPDYDKTDGVGNYLVRYEKDNAPMTYYFHEATDFVGTNMKAAFLKKCKNDPQKWFTVDGDKKHKSVEEQKDESLEWPFPIHQEIGGNCVKNAFLNLGVDEHFLQSVPRIATIGNVIHLLMHAKKFPFQICSRQQTQNVGKFVLNTEGHCLSLCDGVYLDTDSDYPFPSSTLESLDVTKISKIYELVPRKVK